MLRREEARASLLEAVRASDRLVLLGDTIELRHGPLGDALVVAEPILSELGAALGPEREVVLVAGNHDHGLVRGWLQRRAARPQPGPLGLEAAVDWVDGDLLAMVARFLAPARVRVAYPGVWLRDDVYAIHGHYADRHNTVPLIERLGAALMTRVVTEPQGGPRQSEDYEAVLAPIYAWIEGVAQSGGVHGHGSGGFQVRAWQMLQRPGGRMTLRGAGAAAAFGTVVALLNAAKLGPFGTDVSGPGLRRGALRAFWEVVDRLRVGAPHVIFGHTHRAGPLPGDDRSEWVGNGAALLNTGSWTYDRGFLRDSLRGNPYRPGFCAVLRESAPPELINLLDGSEPGQA